MQKKVKCSKQHLSQFKPGNTTTSMEQENMGGTTFPVDDRQVKDDVISPYSPEIIGGPYNRAT